MSRWIRFWFAVEDTRPLELVRIGVGAALFLSYLMLAGHVAEFYSDAGWMPLEHAPSLGERASILNLLTAPWAVRAVWVVCLGSLLALAAGWQTGIAKWLALVCHLSFVHRAPMLTYGLDHITTILLLLVCVAPVGQSLCVRPPANFPAFVRPLDRARRSASLRLCQVQMAVIFFFAGAQKLRGESWWDGDAIWYALADQEFQAMPLEPFADNMWLVNALTYGSVLIELGYAFLIWDRKTRPLALVGALCLHAGIAAMLGLVLFALGMAAGHLAFTPSTWIDRVTDWAKARGRRRRAPR